ncbi:MAG: hypothetical protein K2X97_19895 [Mycobacteriaceae bacterium]|nr:hypothetical protein [Mycobacteriaceae bacterium]
MRLRFGTHEFHSYIDTRSALLDELHEWLAPDEPECDDVVSDVKCFLDWRYRESVGALDEFELGDVSEFVLRWCPRLLSGRPDAAINLCFAVGAYLDFMAATGRLVGGTERAARLRRLVDDLVPTVLAEVREPTTPDGSSRAADLYQLPFLSLPPPSADVVAAAAAAPYLSTFQALRDYAGVEGRGLTDRGHLEVADGRALVALLGTGDVIDPKVGSITIRTESTANLRRLNFILDVALEAGAVGVRQHRLVPEPGWETLDPVAKTKALFAAVIKHGPLQSLSLEGGVDEELSTLLDHGIVHWLVPLLARDGDELPFESLIEWVEMVLIQQAGWHWPDEEMLLEEALEQSLGHLLAVLHEAGVVRWTHRREVRQILGPGSWIGGLVALTPLGRHIVPDHLAASGYRLRRLDRIGDWDADDLLETLVQLEASTHAALIANWRPDLPAGERARMFTEAIVASPSAAARVAGIKALDSFDVAVVEPLVRQLLDTPVAGHAALWLISHQRAEAATLSSFLDIAVLVDALAVNAEEPERLCAFFGGLYEPFELLEEMWRHPAPETALVLDALGHHLQDKLLAKAARKAAVKHRSWMANRQLTSE